jgi:hypothetical protein
MVLGVQQLQRNVSILFCRPAIPTHCHVVSTVKLYSPQILQRCNQAKRAEGATLSLGQCQQQTASASEQ